jgi:anti-anti-sigma factor
MLAPLRITERTIDDILVLELDGQLVFDEGARILREHLMASLNAGSRHLLLDLHKVTYVDSGGIGALVEMHTFVERMGGRLLLTRPSRSAERVLNITHLWSVLEVFEEEETAVRKMH